MIGVFFHSFLLHGERNFGTFPFCISREIIAIISCGGELAQHDDFPQNLCNVDLSKNCLRACAAQFDFLKSGSVVASFFMFYV